MLNEFPWDVAIAVQVVDVKTVAGLLRRIALDVIYQTNLTKENREFLSIWKRKLLGMNM